MNTSISLFRKSKTWITFASLLLFVMVVVGLSTPAYHLQYDGIKVSYTVFYVEETAKSVSFTQEIGKTSICPEVLYRLQASSAFLILTAVASCLTATVSILDHVHPFNNPYVRFGVCAVTWLFSKVSWVLMVSASKMDCFLNLPIKYGPALICVTFAWCVFTILVGILLIKLPLVRKSSVVMLVFGTPPEEEDPQTTEAEDGASQRHAEVGTRPFRGLIIAALQVALMGFAIGSIYNPVYTATHFEGTIPLSIALSSEKVCLSKNGGLAECVSYHDLGCNKLTEALAKAKSLFIATAVFASFASSVGVLEALGVFNKLGKFKVLLHMGGWIPISIAIYSYVYIRSHFTGDKQLYCTFTLDEMYKSNASGLGPAPDLMLAGAIWGFVGILFAVLMWDKKPVRSARNDAESSYQNAAAVHSKFGSDCDGATKSVNGGLESPTGAKETDGLVGGREKEY